MRRSIIALVAVAIGALVIAPAALAHHGPHHRRHHRKHQVDKPAPTVAATVMSFTAATATTPSSLVIKLPNGNTETGAVTNHTELRCDAPAATPTLPTSTTTARTHDHGSGGGPGSGDNDNQGRGDDNGQDQNDNDPGDDNDNNDNNQAPPPVAAPSCTTANLTAGTGLAEANLKVDANGATFKELEIILPSA